MVFQNINHLKEVLNEVAAVLHEAADEGDEDGILTASEGNTSGSQGGTNSLALYFLVLFYFEFSILDTF